MCLLSLTTACVCIRWRWRHAATRTHTHKHTHRSFIATRYAAVRSPVRAGFSRISHFVSFIVHMNTLLLWFDNNYSERRGCLIAANGMFVYCRCIWAACVWCSCLYRSKYWITCCLRGAYVLKSHVAERHLGPTFTKRNSNWNNATVCGALSVRVYVPCICACVHVYVLHVALDFAADCTVRSSTAHSLAPWPIHWWCLMW